MRKKTEPHTQQHPKTSRTGASKKGQIAKETNASRSDREECALDDRSHRTIALIERFRVRRRGRSRQTCRSAKNMERPRSPSPYR